MKSMKVVMILIDVYDKVTSFTSSGVRAASNSILCTLPSSPECDLCNQYNLCNLMREVPEITLDFATILFIAVKPCSMERGAAQVVDRRRRSQAATIFSHFQEKKSPPLESECWKYIISV